eukprot:601098_1
MFVLASVLVILWFSICNTANSLYIDISDETSYYVSPNVLIWRSANNYCRNICGSSLISIHSLNDHLAAQLSFTNTAFAHSMPTANIWLGLYYSTRDNVWRWSDSTVFDYGNSHWIYKENSNQTVALFHLKKNRRSAP